MVINKDYVSQSDLFKKINVIGLGYIGLPTAAVFASRGISVVGVDICEQTVTTINQGEVHIEEPDLDIIVRAAVSTGNLVAKTEAETADAFLIAVPTPINDQQEPDLSYIRSAAEMIAPALCKGNLVILESTVPVGATEKLITWLSELRPDLMIPKTAHDSADVYIAHCPERVLPGQVLQELVANDRVIGGITIQCCERAKALYEIISKGICLLTNSRTAELVKLTENAYRDVNIAFANELSMICDRLNIDIWELIKLSNHHPRVNILNPGPGVGGHCIAVDPWFIVHSAPEQSRLIKQAREVNDYKPYFVLAKVKQAAEQFKVPVIACLGLSFKADVDDLRESPAVKIAQLICSQVTAKVIIVEPYISEIPKQISGSDIELMTYIDALAIANILLVLVDHQEFKLIPKETIKSKIVIDTRGIW